MHIYQLAHTHLNKLIYFNVICDINCFLILITLIFIKMKNKIAVSVSVMFLVLAIFLQSCSSQYGDYKTEDGNQYIFMNKDKVTCLVKLEGVEGSSGVFEIDEEKITIYIGGATIEGKIGGDGILIGTDLFEKE